VKSLGRHILAEFFNCDKDILNNSTQIEKLMIDAAKEANATVLSTSVRTFEPFGVSAVVIIAESHLTIHTWPEYGYAAVDFFTCGDQADPWKAYLFLIKELKAKRTTEKEVLRGIVSDLDITV
jgi:S-adenosylmethionine decarboxylase